MADGLFTNIPVLADEQLSPAERLRGEIANMVLALQNHARAAYHGLECLLWQHG